MSVEFYSYPSEHAGFKIGDKISYGAGKTVYTLTRIQIRTCDGSAYFHVKSDKTEQNYHKINLIRHA